MHKKILFSFICSIFLFLQGSAQIPDQINARKAIEIDGQVNFIDAGTHNRNIGNEVTLEAWTRTNGQQYQWVIGKQNLSRGFNLNIQNGSASFACVTLAGTPVSSGLSQTKVNDNKWHHLAGTYKAGKLEIWVDGVLENTSLANAQLVNLVSTAPLIIAQNPLVPAQFFKGQIGEIKLWNVARTEYQIRTFMAKVVKFTSPDLVGYFRCDNGDIYPRTASVLYDFADQPVNGQLNSGLLKYVITAPPIGDESIFYYGSDLATRSLKMTGDKADTITIREITGSARGFHLYKSFTAYSTTGFLPLIHSKVPYYYGMLAAGDTSTTFQVKITRDESYCTLTLLLYTRKDSRTSFAKIRPGPYNYKLDSVSRYTAKGRGELSFILPNSDAPPVKVFFNGTIAKCPENQPTTLTASKGYFFLWNTGERTKSIKVASAGKYWVKIKDYCTDLGSDTFRVEIAPPVKLPVLKTSDTILCQNDFLKLSLPKGYLYKWSDGSAADTLLVTAAGTYAVTVTDPRCGNSESSSVKVKTVACNPEKVFIPNLITPNNDGQNDYFATVGLPSGQYGLTIYNRWGKQVYQTTSYKNEWNAEGLGAGIYYYLFQSARSAKSYKGYVEVVR